jgi:hypothetical protein
MGRRFGDGLEAEEADSYIERRVQYLRILEDRVGKLPRTPLLGTWVNKTCAPDRSGLEEDDSERPEALLDNQR